MPDIFTTNKRSEVMSRIRGSRNKATELQMVALLRQEGISGWRRGVALFGKPDFTFTKQRVLIFVDGCFWHGCPKAKHSPLPKTRAEWWKAKLDRNKERDREVTLYLTKLGWRVVRIWECDLAQKHWPRIVRQLTRALERTTAIPPVPR